MLDHARTGSGERFVVALDKLLDQYISLAYHGIRARIHGFKVEIKRDYDADIEAIELMPQEIGRVILNLLDNAFYAVYERTKEEEEFAPTVRISTHLVSFSDEKPGVEVRIADNGVGIPKEIADKVFEPFYTTKPTGSGTGLGLSLSYDIVTQGHGGTLRLESEPGKGTTFIIGLPY